MNRIELEIYKAAKHRLSIGREIMTDAETIVEQAKEIERYRKKIHYLEKALREEVAKKKQIGDICEVKIGDDSQLFKLTNMVITYHKDQKPTVNIEGCLFDE